MSKTSLKPLLFSAHFNIPESDLSKLGVFNPALNVDTLLFPDPLLLERSEHPEMQEGRAAFDDHFDKVRRLLLRSSGDKDSVAWKAADRLLSFPEIRGTCLGYGSGTISGSGAGPLTTARLMQTGYEIAVLGIDDPDLFMAMGLFEDDFGPDLIGDMFTNVVFSNILQFNQRIYRSLDVPTQEFEIRLRNGSKHIGNFALNPVSRHDTPVILMPLDILRDLPVALDWRGVQQVSEQNSEFRDNLNASMAALWSKKTLESKSHLRSWALSSATAFGDLLDMLHGMDGRPYDFAGDKLGELVWRTFGERLLSEHPCEIRNPQKLDGLTATKIVDQIIDQFAFLVEKRDIWRELYNDAGEPRLEKAAQRLFYMTALSYCEANGLDITPEAETGRGPVDFKFSSGINERILVEIKLSKNSQTVKGYSRQLQIYNSAEKAFDSRYIIIDVGGMGDKLKKVRAEEQRQIKLTGSAPKIIAIDGLPRVSASKAA